MTPHERMKRPEPERTHPIRNWWTLFGPPGAFMSPMPPPSVGTRPEAEAAPAGDPVARGVEMGYRVIEEYMRQGQNVARLMWSPYLGGTASPQDEMQQRMGAMFRSFSDFASMWLQLTGMVGREGFSSREPHREPVMGTAGPFEMGGAPVTAGAPTADSEAPRTVPDAQVVTPLVLTLDIESPWRTEVSVDLRPRSCGLPLKVYDLRAPEPDKPRLTGVTLESFPAEERVAIHVRIPEDQPPGVYSGIILDERTSLPRGTLSVRLAPR